MSYLRIASLFVFVFLVLATGVVTLACQVPPRVAPDVDHLTETYLLHAAKPPKM